MHFLLLLLGLSLAWWSRHGFDARLNVAIENQRGRWHSRWQWTLILFLFAPLLLIMTAIAILCMGPSGQMVMPWEGWLSYGLAIGFLLAAICLGIILAWEGWQTIRQVRQHSTIDLQGNIAHLLPTAELYSARIGFWNPDLVVSQGLLDMLDQDHLEAVLTHEQAHADYHDTFWFFWLGWLRRLTPWLPHTEFIWQELLLLREMRADRHATDTIDPLVLAESLLLVVSAPRLQSDICAAFSLTVSRDRLMERIDSLLASSDSPNPSQPMLLAKWSFGWLLLALLPLLIIPFHVG